MGGGVEDAKVAVGVGFLGRGALRGIFVEVKFFHARREEARSEQGDTEAEDENDERGFSEKFAGVQPVEDKVNESDGGAPLLEDHVALDENLRDGAWHPIGAEDLADFRAEEGWADDGGEKDHGAQPNRRVE